ncbi:hypothetical protein J2S17_002845 [Cytobacillus purgationiresistens]|uniref:Uncharacterized protein n=1 Tax=Cytobacillus purgationiresistens TaxID=863449 RepID=A0ABU0AI80_9BACI|nr:hypothetical protein [Cytobacillus purgationiresistens]
MISPLRQSTLLAAMDKFYIFFRSVDYSNCIDIKEGKNVNEEKLIFKGRILWKN